MQDLYAKCGINCGRCLSYKENLKTEEDKKRCSDGWYKYHGFRITVKPCEGCQIPPDEKLTYRVCPVSHIRNCALKTGVTTCAQCSAYPCTAVREHKDIGREDVAARLGGPVPEEDYKAFIEPYEGLTHLKTIRASLSPEEIVKALQVPPFRPVTVDFPDDVAVTDETRAFKALHQLLTHISTVDIDSYATRELLKKRTKYFLKVLWVFGRYGTLTETDGLHLDVDSETYYNQKLNMKWSTIQKYFELFAVYDVHCTFIPLGDGWLAPSGWLRRKTKSCPKGWLMTMEFGDSAGGEPALRALSQYTADLDRKYGKTASRYFSKADMRLLQ